MKQERPESEYVQYEEPAEPPRRAGDPGRWERGSAMYRPPEHRSGAGPAWWIGALLVLVGGLWLGALTLSQLSSRTVAIPAIERGVAALTEVDALLAIHEGELCDLAASESALEVSSFPVRGVEVAVSDIQCPGGRLDREALRALLLSRSAEQVYSLGADAFRDEGAELEAASILSTSGATRATLDSIGSKMHSRMTTAAWVLGAVSAVLLAAVLAVGRGVRRFAGVGLVLILIAAPMLLGTGLAWWGLGRLFHGAGVGSEFVAITRSLLELPLRNAVVVLGAGTALMAPVLVVDALVRRADRRAWWEYSR